MARVVVLGTAAAVADGRHGHTCLAVETSDGFFLIDSGDGPLARLQRVGLEPSRLQGVVVTHFHPDHVASLPVLVVSSWLLGRVEPLPVYGLPDSIERLAAMMRLYRCGEWAGFAGMQYHCVGEKPGDLVVEGDGLRITAAPTVHSVPSMALRFERPDGSAVAYSSDTEPCDGVVALASGAEILFHEATGPMVGHSGPGQAGEVARQAGARRLVLVHYPPDPADRPDWQASAAEAFGGPAELAEDFGLYGF